MGSEGYALAICCKHSYLSITEVKWAISTSDWWSLIEVIVELVEL